ncbi:hypothetical protein [Bacteroides cellulosilyticus]|jgi:hypothetical protein|uniref:hypothetical protein n=1 Tax=Bacteroides cellulosilyticus TaxID=246787 RepID=UPI0018ACC955|nr:MULTISPECIES: hypothetical protein [Bacteroides]
MEYQIIPISSLKRIESWLTDETGFSLSMLHNELDYISDVYLLGKQFPVEIQDLYLSIKKEEQDIPYPNRGTDEDKYKFSLTVGKNLVLKSGDFEADYILNLWNLYDTNEDSACEEQDQDIFNGILLIVAIYYKYTQTNGYFDFGDYVADPEQIQYTYSVRPDMLNLYKMFHEKKKTKNNTITIEYNKQKIELTNDDNWFLNMITPYLDKYLGIPSLEEAEAELNKDYPTTGKRGRKRENAILDTVTLSIYNLLRHSSFAAKGKGLTDNEGKFILSLLVYLRLIDEDSSKNDILNLRATIRNLQKYEVRPNWWRIPMCKTSPNNPVEHLKSYW